MALACAFTDTATFYEGTNVVGHVLTCGSVFLIGSGGEAYKDERRVVETLFSDPLHEALRKSYIIELEKNESR
jgi:hypothetical protein